MTTVGILGVGRMGAAMSRALAARGYDLVLWNRSQDSAARVAMELGGQVAERPAEVAGASDVCISMLSNGAAVDAVYGGPGGLISGARRGNILIDASTVPPSTLRRHEASVRAAGAGILDAPVSGSVALAEAGRLTIMVGGETDDVERARPVLEALATSVFHMGPLGSGAAMKLAVNTVIFGLNEALAEGLILAEAAGIGRVAAYDVLTASAAGAPFVGYKRAAFLEPEATPVAFSLALAAKDLRLIAEFASQLAQSTPGTRTALETVEAAIRSVGGERDFSAVASHLRGIATSENSPPVGR